MQSLLYVDVIDVDKDEVCHAVFIRFCYVENFISKFHWKL